MNDIAKITEKDSPNLSESHLPMNLNNEDALYSREFWIEIPTEEQSMLLNLFRQYGVVFTMYEITDVSPQVTMAVCRYGQTYNESFTIVQKICKQMGVDEIIVSHGGISTIDSDGELINYSSQD